MANDNLSFSLLPNEYCVCRLDPGQGVPGPIAEGFYSVTVTGDEISVVCLAQAAPAGEKCESGWRILRIDGVLDFSLIGILATVSTILAAARVSLFAISTFDTDYILVKQADMVKAVDALEAEGYEIVERN